MFPVNETLGVTLTICRTVITIYISRVKVTDKLLYLKFVVAGLLAKTNAVEASDICQYS